MSEEQESMVNTPEEQNVAQEVTEAPVDTAAEAAPAEAVEPQQEAPVYAETYEQPQIIVQRERGFSHYVGFALISVLCICFFFMPGIAITFLVSLIPGVALGAIAVWTFSSILSVVAWLIFKIKISGFKRSFYAYIGLCIAVLAILIAVEILTEANVFSKIIAMLTGADAL